MFMKKSLVDKSTTFHYIQCMGYKTEVYVQGEWSTNAVVWPDAESADKAGYDLLCRWFVPTDYRVVEVDEEPNRPTWEEYVAQNGLPPQSVSL
jgi:hypothetical protein